MNTPRVAHSLWTRGRHASGTFVLPFWLRGAQAAVLGGFEPGAFLDAMTRYGVTHTNLVPTMLQMLLATGRAPTRPAGLRSVVYGASPMPRPVIEEAMATWGPIFTQYYMYLIDRTCDMIVSGAYNVYPREVEDALHAHPDVAECAVVGAPDERWVEAVVAFVVRRPGATVTADELTAHVRARLAGYKVPKRVEFVGAIPKSGVGKILRRALRAPLWAGHQRTR